MTTFRSPTAAKLGARFGPTNRTQLAKWPQTASTFRPANPTTVRTTGQLWPRGNTR